MFEIFRNPIKVREMRKQIVELQNSVNILIGGATEQASSRGNPYRTYQGAITALAQKYEGTAQYGVNQIRNIIDIRSAFIIGQGIQLNCEDEKLYSRELEFINDMIRYNNFDEEMPQELAKEAEIEGRSLVKLIPNKEKQNVDIRYVSYNTNNYTVISSPDDYQKYLKVTGKTRSSGNTIDGYKYVELNLDASEFVYKKFAGRVDKVNDIMPKTAMVLRHCEDLDKALCDWREANYFFAVPTPYFKCVDVNEIKTTAAKINEVNWRVGKAFIGTADFKMVEISGSGMNSIKEEILALAKFISGATGVPVHFLGLPDLMSNRAVSTDLFEFINASTNKERHIWEGFYEELFDKALLMANKEFKRNYATGKIKAKILSITESQIRQLAEIWLPLYSAGVVDLRYILGKIPDIDVEEQISSQEESALKMFEKVKQQEKEQIEDVPLEEEVKV